MILALPARAKLNLDLKVIGRRADGHHDIKTTMQTIELHDLLLTEAADTTVLTVSGLAVDADDNSVLRAQHVMEHAARRKLPARFHLHKRIPAGSGMGGASSDAATALRALKALYALDVDEAAVAAEVGSDVPFFVHGGAAIAEGRGEHVMPIKTTHTWFAIAWPRIELSTKSVYEAWDQVRGDDLRKAAEHVEPGLKDFARRLGDGWRMTGSGSAFFKATKTQRDAEKAIAHLDCWTRVTSAA